MAQYQLMQIRAQYGYVGIPGEPEQAHRALLATDITRFLERPYVPEQRAPDLDVPPGQPIGDEDW
jgi:hypothetical protein